MKLAEYIKMQIELGTDEFDIRIDDELNVIETGQHRIKFNVR